MHRGCASRAVHDLHGSRERLLRRFALGASLAALSLGVGVSPAGAAITIGALAPGTSPETNCGGGPPRDQVIPVVTSGNSYVVPGTGVLTSWSHNAAAGAGQLLGLKVFRHLGGPEFMALAHNGPRALAPGLLNTFPVNIPVSAGDIIGLTLGDGLPPEACEFEGTSYEWNGPSGMPLADGGSTVFSRLSNPIYALNISAVFEPTNSFALGSITRNKKKGTATLTLNLPNPGELTGSGKGVKVANAAVISKTVSAPGKVKLTIRAKGKKMTTLNETGKVEVRPKITYTPTGGDPSTQSLKVKLKKKL